MTPSQKAAAPTPAYLVTDHRLKELLIDGTEVRAKAHLAAAQVLASGRPVIRLSGGYDLGLSRKELVQEVGRLRAGGESALQIQSTTEPPAAGTESPLTMAVIFWEETEHVMLLTRTDFTVDKGERWQSQAAAWIAGGGQVQILNVTFDLDHPMIDGASEFVETPITAWWDGDQSLGQWIEEEARLKTADELLDYVEGGDQDDEDEDENDEDEE